MTMLFHCIQKNICNIYFKFIIQTGENETCSKPGKFNNLYSSSFSCLFLQTNNFSLHLFNIDFFFQTCNSDPCEEKNRLTLLVSGDRSTSCKDQSLKLCDSVLRSSWYRPMKNSIDVKMASSCVERYSCGTEEPIWLKGII